MVWRLGDALLEVPRLPSCVGVAPQGMELGLVFNDSLSLIILSPLRDSYVVVEMLTRAREGKKIKH